MPVYSPLLIPMTVITGDVQFDMSVVTTDAELAIETVAQIVTSTNPTFDGPYEFTPTNEAQTIPIMDHVATGDIIINPIPSNYGLITWNGSVITVS